MAADEDSLERDAASNDDSNAVAGATKVGNKSAQSRIASPAVDESAPSGTATRRNSTSSQLSSNQPAAPIYGTRSRRQRGAARINYAEDVEMDFEMQQPLSAQHQQENGDNHGEDSDEDESAPERDEQSQAEATAEKKSAEKVKRGPRGGKKPKTNGWSTVNGSKDVTPAADTSSTPAAAPTPTLPRKRKAAAVATQNIAAGSQPAAPAITNGKKNSTASTRGTSERETNMVTFEKSNARLNKDGHLVSDDGQVFAPDNHVYLICEPPGEPYYLGRIMEFRTKEPNDPTTQVEYLRINWAYRPRDVQRFANDSRLVFVTMHSDLCPLTSLRGKCQIKHRAEIDDIDAYRQIPDSFWFNQCFDRFISRAYEVVPTSQVVNVPKNVKEALDTRWKYIVVESIRLKELTSAVKSCTRCSGFCANDDSVDCALCKKTYHLQCVRPPLLKKPSRGFAWACAVCSRDQERKLEARRTPLVGDGATDAEEEEVVEEEEEHAAEEVKRSALDDGDLKMDDAAPEAEIAHAKMWPMRYLGIHCRVEDVLQYEDRAIYPRASSRLGPKHQATISEWYGRPVQLTKPIEVKRRWIKAGNKKIAQITKDSQAALEADRIAKAKRPKWIEDEPPGYVARGEDYPNDDKTNNTAQTVFTLPEVGEPSSRGLDDDVVARSGEITDTYMAKARDIARSIGVEPYSTDFLDRAVSLLQRHCFNMDGALKELKKTKAVGAWPTSRWGWATRDALRDPRLTLTDEQKRRFADGVRRYGSELRLVRQHVRTISHGDTVRYWYYWKKTPQGRKIWGAYDGRKHASKKKAVAVENSSKLLDDIAHNQDDSAFDNQKVYDLTRRMQCKFCSVKHSRFWRRAPNTNPGETVLGDQRTKDKNTQFAVALCQRCARLWRKYAIRWEDEEECAKRLQQGAGKAWKRRVDEELVKEWKIAIETAHLPPIEPEDMPGVIPRRISEEPAKKKAKGTDGTPAPVPVPVVEKKKAPPAPPPPPPPPKEPTPPPVPALPKMRTFPCAVCDTYETPGTSDPLLICRDCRLAVHRGCYGVSDTKNSLKWSCDPCSNDRRELAMSASDPAAYRYECVLCPVKHTEVSMVEPPKISHKKKTDRDRERERMEKELAEQFVFNYRQLQLERGRPVVPREALKRTADNKWVHVTCALWTPEVRYSSAKALEVAEGIPLIPRMRREQICKLCKTSIGACVSCHHCHAPIHIACAYRHNYIFGFDVVPVKVSRRDGVTMVKLGDETGTMTAAIWCKEHSSSSIKTKIHYLNDRVDDSGKIALQLFAETYKQADLTLTGTARKANYLDEITRSSAPSVTSGPNRRVSTISNTGHKSQRNSISGIPKEDTDSDIRMASPEPGELERQCAVCNIDVSPRWWKHEAVKGPTPTPALAPLPSSAVPPAQPVQQPNGLAINGLGHDILNPESSRIGESDGSAVASGHAPSIVGRPLLNGTSELTEKAVKPGDADEIRYDCNKCHWKRINDPESLIKPVKEPTPPPEPVHSPPRPVPERPYAGPPAALPTHPPPTWLPFSNGPSRSPPMPSHIPPPPHAAYPGHHGPSPSVGYPFNQHQPPPAMHHPGYSAPAPPHSGPAPLHVIQAAIPNGLPSPHGPPPLRSPSFPPPAINGSLPPVPRQSGSPYSGPMLPVGGYHGVRINGGSPVPQTAGLPAAGLNSIIGRPSTPRDPPTVPNTPRLAHGASASPNVRNILNND